jgi:choice-of-anchor C domain-containing protein
MKRLLFAVTLVLTASAAHAASFTNGSFEVGVDPGGFTTKPAGSLDITGWVVLPINIDYIGTYWQAAEGNRSIDLNGGATGGIAQTFDTIAGQLYRVRFALAGNPDGPPVDPTVRVSAGADVEDFTFLGAGTSRPSMGWVYREFEFTALSASTTLAFNSLESGFFGPAIDDVSVAPEPATMALLGAGLLAVAARRRRARQ